MLDNIGGSELIVIAVILSLLLGSKRLAEIGKGIGEVFREFKKAQEEPKKEV